MKQRERRALIGLRVEVPFLPCGCVGKIAFPNVLALHLEADESRKALGSSPESAKN